ncbi:MAG: beta-lactamase family protein [Cyclobacteriaceae bacterium]|nr:beta-lactamase family protein [Cyclobacteriaceae bacterium]
MKSRLYKHLLCAVLLLIVAQANAQLDPAKIKSLIDSLRLAGNLPGLSVSIVIDENPPVNFTSGFSDREKSTLLKPTDRLLQGSVGKTYAAAVALKLVESGKLKLEEKAATYLGHFNWFARIPNANDITVKMLMNHTSGVMRYEFKEQFATDLTNTPDKTWKPEELLHYVLDEQPSFKAGEGWEYSDTNYILLGMIIEKITGQAYYSALQKDILTPFKLSNTFPSDRINLPGLSQGYAGKDNPFGGQDRVIKENGDFIINPQFEWTGGGIYSTTEDLARWGKLLYGGQVLNSQSMALMLDGVPAKLGPNSKYGLGVIIRQTPQGLAFGHSGFFPGYLTEMIYFPEHNMCMALQTNTSDVKNIKLGLYRMALTITDHLIKK